jgi:lysyl-tRNA synthetase class II
VVAIGDATCLEPMARAWAAAPGSEAWWRDRLADAATDIMHRTRLSGRSALVKRIRQKWPKFL